MTRVAVLLLALVGANAVQAASVIEYGAFWATRLGTLLPNTNDCDGSFSDGCVRSSTYWGSHYPGAPTPEKDLPWPEPALLVSDILAAGPNLGPMCPDVFRAIAIQDLGDFEAIPGGGYQAGLYYLKNSKYSYAICYGINGDECNATFTTPITIFPAFVNPPPGVFGADVYTIQELVAGEGDKPCYVVAGQYFAAMNNLCSGSCLGYPDMNVTVAAAMVDAAKFIFGAECELEGHLTANFTEDAANALLVLRDYNMGQWVVKDNECRGEYGPIMCNDITPNSTQCSFSSQPADCKGDSCDGGCTYDASYWKTHRSSVSVPKKNKPLYPSWNTICPLDFLNASGLTCTTAGVCTPDLEVSPYPYMPVFTHAEVLDAAPKNGEACLIAAKQVIAADLNHHCNSACITDDGEMAVSEAKAIMEIECVDITVNNKGKTSNGLDSSVTFNTTSYNRRVRLLALAEYLRDYNEGRFVGPGPCDSSIADMLSVMSAIAEASCEDGAASATAKVNTSGNGWSIAAVILLIVLIVWKLGAACVSFVWGDSYNGLPDSKLGTAFVLGSAPMPQQQQGNRRAHAGNISDY